MQLSDNVQLDNILVHQKNYILRLINDGMLQAAEASLSTVRELWLATEYGYKIREIEMRISAKMAEMCLQVA